MPSWKRNCTRPTRRAHEQPDHIKYEPDDRYEREFAELESRAAPAIEKLIAGTRHLQQTDSKDLLRTMSLGEITACKELIVSSTTRTPDSMKATIVRSRLELGEAISKLDLRPLRRFPEEVQVTFLRLIEWSAMAHVASSSHRHAEGGFDIDKSGLAVAANSNPNSRFILGSCGVAHLPIAGDPENLDGTWLPISPNHAIALDNDPGTIVCYRDWESLCSRINQALARDSRMIAAIPGAWWSGSRIQRTQHEQRQDPFL